MLIALACLELLLSTGVARALPADAYHVESLSYSGATHTAVRGVDAAGRALGYWNYFSQAPPIPLGAEPDDEGYFLWEGGTYTPFAIPGLTSVNIFLMNVAGAMWGASDQGAFVYRDGDLDIVQSPATDVTLVQGVDAAGRVYGVLANYPPGADPDAPIVPLDPVSNFVWEDGVFSDLELLLADATLHGVRQDGVLWGSDPQVSFLQDGSSLTILDHPDFDYTGVLMLSNEGEVYGFGLTADGEIYESTDFFWDPIGGFQDWPADQDLPGTNLRPQNQMNEAGVFWGYGGAPNTAYIATPIPEPSTALLLALGLALMGRAQPSAGSSPSVRARATSSS